MIRMLCAFMAFFLVFAVSAPARAACPAAPGGQDGDIIYNSDHKVFQYCNGTDWVAMHRFGAGTGGCGDPPGAEGDLIYNTDYRVLQGCAGAAWHGMGPVRTVPATIVPDGLVGYWRFDEDSGPTAHDSSGNGLDGALLNGPVWQPAGGIQGGALQFDGTNDRVSVPDPGANSILDFPGGTSITVTAWIRPTNASGCCQTVVLKGNAASSGNYYLVVENFGGGSTMDFGFYSGGDYREIYGNPNLIQNNVWRFVTARYTFGTGPGALYVDGASAGLNLYNSPYSRSPTVNNAALSFGADTSGGYRFAGLMDNIRIYNRLLSPAEITQIYNYELAGESNCGNPPGAAGDVLYNSASHVVQYCDGIDWVGIGAGP